MIHGDIITLVKHGIVARQKALQPLGIYDQSICWGAWVVNPHKERRDCKCPHLVVSPFHPSSWAFMMRLQLTLKNRKGSLADAAGVLKENNLSILLADCTPTGFSHATWKVIAESTRSSLSSLRRRKEKLDRLKNSHVCVDPDSSADEAYQQLDEDYKKLANEIAAEMLYHVREIEEAFKQLQSKEEQKAVLHSWQADDSSPYLYDKASVSELLGDQLGSTSEVNALLNAHIGKPATVLWMQRMAYFSLYGGVFDVPFSLRYDARASLLRMNRPEIFDSGSFQLAPLPMLAVGTFDSDNKFLRVNPVTSELLNHELTQIQVEYKVQRSRSPQKEAASNGLLKLLSDELSAAEADLVQISNKWTRYEHYDEAGLIYFVGDVAKSRYEEIKARLKLLELSSEKPDAVKILDVKVNEYPQKKLFVSLHFGHPRDRNIRAIVKDAAREKGFDDVTVETYVAPTTRRVVDEIDTSQAFLQLLLFRHDEQPDSTSFSWLDFEYGVAEGKGIPTMRLVDISRVSYGWWQNRITINQDQNVKEFRLDLSDDDLSRQIQDAMGELLGEVVRRQAEYSPER